MTKTADMSEEDTQAKEPPASTAAELAILAATARQVRLTAFERPAYGGRV